MKKFQSIKFKIILIAAAIFASALFSGIAYGTALNESVDNLRNPIISKSYGLINSFWTVKELIYLTSVTTDSTDYATYLQQYKNELKALNEKACDLSGLIIKDIEDKKLSSLRYFSKLYKTKSPVEKLSLEMIARPIIEKVRQIILENQNTPRSEISGEFTTVEEFKAEYFPGYDSELNPNYYYRKGREISSEVLDVYWKEIKNTHEAQEEVSSEVTLEYLEQLYNNDDVSDIEETSGVFEKIIDGIPTKCINVTFLAKVQITTISKRKYASTKVWFELLVNKTSILVNKWEVCGKTYEMHEIYAGSEVISGPGETPPPAGQAAPVPPAPRTPPETR
ncbi:MAG TPA: hypothetical protein PKK26_05085 [Candidatus Wallbacteria bacterium]|nr:hypothetical protein [Candidatus Wallbacteria bacterium]